MTVFSRFFVCVIVSAPVGTGCSGTGGAEDPVQGAAAQAGADDPDDNGNYNFAFAADAPLENDPGAGFAADEQLNEKTGEEVDRAVETTGATGVESDLSGVTPGDEISHSTTQQIPMEINADVERWIDYFTRDRERFSRFLERGERYKATIAAVLRDQGIPTEIYYQAMIESGFTTNATSHASAVGIWQFVKGTGARYGLRIDGYVDERRDPLRATIAASLYLKDLYNVFQDWYLAMAAYNAGEGRILGAIMRAKTRDFWTMVKLRALPSETMDYIPKFLAATIIGHNPKKYGFEDLSPETMPSLASVAVPSPIKLSDVAQTTGISLELLKTVNPHIVRGITPPGVATYRIWVPKTDVAAVEGQLERLASLRVRNAKPIAMVPGPADGKPRYHTVQRGETLAKIAGQYGISAAQVRKLNKMRSSKVIRGQKLLLWANNAAPEAAVAAQAAAAGKKYKVKRGDNLNEIAKRFKTSIDQLKRLNNLKHTTLYVGQVLRVGGNGKG